MRTLSKLRILAWSAYLGTLGYIFFEPALRRHAGRLRGKLRDRWVRFCAWRPGGCAPDEVPAQGNPTVADATPGTEPGEANASSASPPPKGC
jgi:hypothetical protein